MEKWSSFLRLSFRVISKQFANGFNELNSVEAKLRAWNIVDVTTREEYWPIRPEQEEDLRNKGILLFYTASGQIQILCRTRRWLIAVDPEFKAWDTIRDFNLNFCEVEKVSRLEPATFDSLSELTNEQLNS